MTKTLTRPTAFYWESDKLLEEPGEAETFLAHLLNHGRELINGASWNSDIDLPMTNPFFIPWEVSIDCFSDPIMTLLFSGWVDGHDPQASLEDALLRARSHLDDPFYRELESLDLMSMDLTAPLDDVELTIVPPPSATSCHAWRIWARNLLNPIIYSDFEIPQVVDLDRAKVEALAGHTLGRALYSGPIAAILCAAAKSGYDVQSVADAATSTFAAVVEPGVEAALAREGESA